MIEKQKDKTSIARGNYLRISPHKARRILNQIRGKKYNDALMILEFMPYRACKTIKKILVSAAANASSKYGYKTKDLIICKTFANAGPTLKRFQPRAQGRAFKIHKPTCHITLEVYRIN